MSTPMETNTEELQEILQTVYNLPNAGGNSKPDLVLSMVLSDDYALSHEINTHIFNGFSIKSGSVADTHAKLLNREEVKVVMEHDYWYGPNHFIGVFHPSIVTTHYHPEQGDAIALTFYLSMFPGRAYREDQFNVIIGTDGIIFVAEVNTI